MGPWSFIHGEAAREGGEDCLVSARGLKTPRAGLSISMGNPHTVVMLGSDGSWTVWTCTACLASPAPVNGTNVEFVVPVDLDVESGACGCYPVCVCTNAAWRDSVLRYRRACGCCCDPFLGW